MADNSEKPANAAFLFFLIIVFIIFPLVNFRFVPDNELTPRFLCLSLLIFGFSFYYFIRPRQFQARENSIFSYGIFYAFTGYFLISALSAFQVINFSEGIYELSKILLQILFFLIVFFLIRSNNNYLLPLLKFINIAVTIFSCWGFFQIYILYISITNKLFANTPSIRDVCSTLANKNLFSEILLLTIPFVILGIRNFDKRWKWFSYINLGMIIFYLIFLQSVTVWMAFAFAFVSVTLLVIICRNYFEGFPAFKIKNFRTVFFVVILALAAGFTAVIINSKKYDDIRIKISYLLNFTGQQKLNNDSQYAINHSVFDRVLMFRNSLKMIQETHFMGAGISNWGVLNAKYGISGIDYLNSGNQLYEHPHNDFLLVFTETGIIGLIFYLLIFIFPIIYCIKIIKSSEPDSKKILTLMTFAFLVVYFFISLFSFPKQRIFHLVLFDIVLAIIVNNYLELNSESKVSGNYFRMIFLFGMPVSVIAFIVGFYRLAGEAHYQKAIIAQTNKNWQLMILEIDKASSRFYSIDYTTTPVLWYRGLANFYAENLDAAFNDFKKAEKVNPFHAHTLNNIASCYELKGNRSEAIAYYQRALAINPYFHDALLNLSIVYYKMEKTDSAYATIMKYSNKNEPKYQEVLTAVLYSKAVKLADTLYDENQKSFLLNKLKENLWLNEMNQQAIASGSSFEDAVKNYIHQNRELQK